MVATLNIHYAREEFLDPAEFKRVLLESGLDAIRPVEDDDRLTRMLRNSNFVLTARLDQPDRRLVGVARCVTDFALCSAQGSGVGRRLLDETRRQLGSGVNLILVSVPEAIGFYEGAGMARIDDAFWFHREH